MKWHKMIAVIAENGFYLFHVHTHRERNSTKLFLCVSVVNAFASISQRGA